MRVFPTRSCLLLLLFSIHPPANAAIIAGFDAARHQRFLEDGSPNPGFFVDESQLSGVAFRRGILITPRHYMTAAHINSPSVTFRGTDGVVRAYDSVSAQTLTTNVPGESTPVASDVRIHTLAVDVHPSIVPVPIIVGDPSALLGHTVIAMDQMVRAGRNRIDAVDIVEFENGTGDTMAFGFSYDTETNGGTGGFLPDEIGLLSGDSGDAALMKIDGQIGLLGSHMGIDVPTGSNANAGDRYDSYSTFLGFYEDQLTQLVEADGYSFGTLSVTAIPEPNGVFVVFLLAIATTLVGRSGRTRKSYSGTSHCGGLQSGGRS